MAANALYVCMDAANFTPDRTPLERAVRMLGPDRIIVTVLPVLIVSLFSQRPIVRAATAGATQGG